MFCNSCLQTPLCNSLMKTQMKIYKNTGTHIIFMKSAMWQHTMCCLYYIYKKQQNISLSRPLYTSLASLYITLMSFSCQELQHYSIVKHMSTYFPVFMQFKELAVCTRFKVYFIHIMFVCSATFVFIISLICWV
jgi:hypothetical protein